MYVVAPTINEIVENLCHEGCRAVRMYIQQIEQNKPVEPLEGLGDKEKTQVLEELRAIIAVYDHRQ